MGVAKVVHLFLQFRGIDGMKRFRKVRFGENAAF